MARAAHRRTSEHGAVQRLQRAETALREIDHKVLRCARAVYLNGDELDRGTLRLTNHSLRFEGWQGSIVIAVQEIVDVRLGTSVLPCRAGIPLLGRMWPGQPHYAESLLISVRAGSRSEPKVATIADLRNGIQWRDDILQCRDDHEGWTQERSRRVQEVEQAKEELEQVRQAHRSDADGR